MPLKSGSIDGLALKKEGGTCRKGNLPKVCMMSSMSSALEYREDSMKADPEAVKIGVAQDGLAGIGTCSRVMKVH